MMPTCLFLPAWPRLKAKGFPFTVLWPPIQWITDIQITWVGISLSVAGEWVGIGSQTKTHPHMHQISDEIDAELSISNQRFFRTWAVTNAICLSIRWVQSRSDWTRESSWIYCRFWPEFRYYAWIWWLFELPRLARMNNMALWITYTSNWWVTTKSQRFSDKRKPARPGFHPSWRNCW